MIPTRFSIESISSRLSGEKPLPKPSYYCRMNPEEQALHTIIGEETHEYYRDPKGKLWRKRLSLQERLQKQRMFYDSRVGHAIVGDEWMRMKLPTRR